MRTCEEHLQRPAIPRQPLTLKLVLLLGVFGGRRRRFVTPYVIVLEGKCG